jgi:hypothetical protein
MFKSTRCELCFGEEHVYTCDRVTRVRYPLNDLTGCYIDDSTQIVIMCSTCRSHGPPSFINKHTLEDATKEDYVNQKEPGTIILKRKLYNNDTYWKTTGRRIFPAFFLPQHKPTTVCGRYGCKKKNVPVVACVSYYDYSGLQVYKWYCADNDENGCVNIECWPDIPFDVMSLKK